MIITKIMKKKDNEKKEKSELSINHGVVSCFAKTN